MLDAGLTDQTEMPAFNICQHAWLFALTGISVWKASPSIEHGASRTQT
jgi:hypothetical protein